MFDRICALTGARTARRDQRIQSLWSGYGEVVRVALDGADVPSVVVKHVRPPRDAHPRKVRSYEVERAWYRDHAARSPARLPHCHDAWSDGDEVFFVLEDLDVVGFAERRRHLSPADVNGCLRWLADFHAAFMGVEPVGLWEVGTYWHLATRPDELRRMRNQRLKARAHELDARLNDVQFKTVVHGDAKPANFCFGPAGVAAVDFQYVGGGCGMRDVAYFLGGTVTLRQRQDALDRYFRYLGEALPPRFDVDAIDAEWRPLYEVAELDFERFLDGWR